MHRELAEVLTASGFVSRRTHGHLQSAINRACAAGELIPLFPGTYAVENTYESLMAALFDWDPDAVLTGGSAAKAWWWRDLEQAHLEASITRRLRREVAGFEATSAVIHPELVVNRRGVRAQIPAASTLDLARRIGPSAFDEAFRRRAVTVRELEWALSLMPGRSGNVELAAYLRDSIDEPWSAFERNAHSILRAAGISGWKTNYGVEVRGEYMVLDIAFPGPKLNIELDGWKYHGDRTSFIQDRRRDVLLTMAGWTPVRFTVETLPLMLPAVRRLLGK